MRKIILSVLSTFLLIDTVGLSSQAQAWWWHRGPVVRERVVVKPAPGIVSSAPVVVGRRPLSSRIIACRNHVPITVMNAERAAWVNACINHLIEPAW